jgi:hypothetical protein
MGWLFRMIVNGERGWNTNEIRTALNVRQVGA